MDAEALAHTGWALGALGYVPEKPWLRSFMGGLLHGNFPSAGFSQDVTMWHEIVWFCCMM
jgi:hypothetical protein